MPKVGLYIASSISSLDFDKIIEPYLKNKNLQVFSNFMHPSIKCFEVDKALSTNLNAQCQQRISDTHVEFYKRYNGTPLCDNQFNFWSHLRFNSNLQLQNYYSFKGWIDQLNKKEDITEFVFVGVSNKTANFIKFDFPNSTFISSGNTDNKKQNNLNLGFTFLKIIFRGTVSFFKPKKKKETLLVSVKASLIPILTKEGIQVKDKFMYYLKNEIEEGKTNALLNSNLFSFKGLKEYSYDDKGNSFDLRLGGILFGALLRPSFYKQIMKTRKVLNSAIKSENSFLGVMFKNNKDGLLTELLYYWSYYFFLKNNKYKNIALTSEMSPGVNSITRVAKQLGINVIGIQHGLINENNFAYNYSNEELKHDNPFPNKLIVWGNDEKKFFEKNKEFLSEVVQAKGNVILDGISYLPKKEEERKFTILYASQPQPIEKYRLQSFSDFTEALLQFKSIEVKAIIRLHPREVLNYSVYQSYLDKLSNYEVELDKGEELFSQIDKSDVLVTSYSTVAKDAIVLRKPIILQDYVGSDLTGLLEKNVAFNSTNAEELYNTITKIQSNELLINKDSYDKALDELYDSLDFEVAKKIAMMLK
ncbi:CDP-glycerol glycerophosphotransferase family protein [Flavobacteriales bacterium]|nr:CDP-glycerol glycerophosphotransferase family protein [Flavobacteriales bacterium]MDB9702042.1 CDP-glycerol glycerophosphotransferase family protein [Flavobacteriales bacterium]